MCPGSDMSNKVTAMKHKEQMDGRLLTGLTERIVEMEGEAEEKQ